MREQIRQWLRHSLEALHSDGVIPDIATPEVTPARDPGHGDYASNIALVLAGRAECKPRALAGKIVAALPPSELLSKVEIAGPGFINFHLRGPVAVAIIGEILAAGERCGCAPAGSRGRALVEFVSANPTGPLHIGHGRGAAYGAALANLLEAAGYEVEREYYVNDQGRQMDLLALSVWLRYLELCGADLPFPKNAYQGDYVWDVAAKLHRGCGTRFVPGADDWAQDVEPCTPADDADGDGAAEARLDALVARMKQRLGDDAYREIFATACDTMLAAIRSEMENFGVHYDRWFSENSLMQNGEVAAAVAELERRGQLYERDGAKWFRSSTFGDEKDRVVVRANGQTTYFASDLAYHLNKYRRGYDLIVNVWGADHHGYVARIEAALKALQLDATRLHTVLVQFVNLFREGEKIGMSTRSGKFVPLSALRREVGRDAVRLFYVMRKYDQHIDFDINLAKSETSDNPVYYLQYAHARICNVFGQMHRRGMGFAPGAAALDTLTEPEEVNLIKLLAQYRGVVNSAATAMEPQLLTTYLKELAGCFHAWYNRCRILVEDRGLCQARLSLSAAVRQVMHNGLLALGASAPEKM